MSNSYSREFFTGTGDGTGLKVTSTTAGAADTIHLAPSDVRDEVWLYAYNDHSADVLLTLLWGDATDPDDYIRKTIPTRAGFTLVIPGLMVDEGKRIKAFAATANEVMIHGYVNRITSTSSGGG
jgi:hypothetical protein|tara:strand:- start:298 stop:669 length:372 start_codon:yes stop_codon:yes gene_type:complete